MNYLDEISGIDRNGDSKSILTIKNQSEDVNIIGPVIIVNERVGYVELDIQFSNCEIEDIWTVYQLIDKGDTQTRFIIIPTQYGGNLHMIAEKPLFWTLTTTDINEGLNVIKILFEADSCTLFTSQAVKDHGE